MNRSEQPSPDETTAERLARVEARLACIEGYLRFEAGAASGAPLPNAARRREDEFEFQVGQNWFATVGILILLIGAAFTLALPYAGLPAAVPSLVGYGVTAAVFLLARLWRRAFALVSENLRGAAMALLYFSTLRLCFFGDRHAFSAASVPGQTLLVLTVTLNLALALPRRSPWLAGLALATGYATALVVGSGWLTLIALAVLAALSVTISRKLSWPGFTLLGIGLTYSTYLLWAIGNPLLGRPLTVAAGPPASLGFLLAYGSILGAGSRGRRARGAEDPIGNVAAVFNCGAAYGLFLTQSLISFAPLMVPAHIIASLVFLASAVVFWVRERSRVATFIYAMTGYVALSIALIEAAPIPQVFIWLSLQSLIVVATAIWFQSRFIVVANFLIYAAIVIAYMALASVETGISLAFGLVALGTARLLNWQQGRLELKTELMRNAYLASALLIFPYALYHLVPGALVGLTWVGVALLYYGMNLIVRNRKYRWMGHATLLFTALYLVVIGINRLQPLYRNVSFLVLGTVLVIVSLIFTRLRARRPARIK